MKQYFDSNIIQQLADNINKGWPSIYETVVMKKVYTVESGTDWKQYIDPIGRVFITLDPEQYGVNHYSRFVSVELVLGDYVLDGELVKNRSKQLRVTFCANRGEINTRDHAMAGEFIKKMQGVFEERLTHLVYPHRSYVEWDKHFPITYSSLWDNMSGKPDFQITGTGYIPIEAYGTIPGVMDLDELSKLIIHFVQPTESLMGYDWYSDVAKTGIITDSFVSAGTINE